MAKYIYNDFIPFEGYDAMCIGNLVFIRNGARVTTTLMNHEAIHCAQWKECLYIFFLPLYVLSFIWQFLKHWNWSKAYRNVCFEREAYAHEKEQGYLSHRERFAWA